MPFIITQTLSNAKIGNLHCKIQIVISQLKIESGRFHNVTRRNRICNLCQLQDIEDEFHFILKCPIYNEYKQKFVKRYYRTRPRVFKLTQLLSTNNIKELNNLGKYLYFAYNKRSSLIVVWIIITELYIFDLSVFICLSVTNLQIFCRLNSDVFGESILRGGGGGGVLSDGVFHKLLCVLKFLCSPLHLIAHPFVLCCTVHNVYIHVCLYICCIL